MANISLSENFVNAYITWMHINGSLSLLMFILCSYLILFKTPTNMESYKWYLLNMIICALIFDIHTTIMYIPLPLFPARVVCITGLYKYFMPNDDIAILMLIQFLSFYGVSILAAFCYRYAIVSNKLHLLHSKPGLLIMFIVHFVYLWPTIGLIMANLIKESEISTFYEESYPGITLAIQGRPCGAIKTGTFADIAVLSIGIDAVSLAVNIFFLARAIHHNLEKNKSSFSSTTYRLHRQLTISLIIQFIIPFVFISIPYFVFSIMGILGVSNGGIYMAYGFQIMTLHTFLNGIAMISCIKPYRNAVTCYVFDKKLPNFIKVAQVSSHVQNLIHNVS